MNVRNTISIALLTAGFATAGFAPHAHAYNFLHGTEFAEAVRDEERVSRSRLKTNDYAERTRDLEQQFAERQHQAGSRLGRDDSIDSGASDMRHERPSSHLSASLVSGDMRLVSGSHVSGDMNMMASTSQVSADVAIAPIGSFENEPMAWADDNWQPPYLAHTGLETYAIALLALLAVTYLRMTLVSKWCIALRKSVFKS